MSVPRLVKLQDLAKEARLGFTTKVSVLNRIIEEIDSIIIGEKVERANNS